MKNEGEGDSDDERKARYKDRDSNISWFRAEVGAHAAIQSILHM